MTKGRQANPLIPDAIHSPGVEVGILVPGYTILREILLVADHNAYHIGEFGILRQIVGTW